MINPPDLIFEPGPHRYTYKGLVVPSVTQSIDWMINFYAPKEVMEAAAQRGTIVHKLTEKWDQGEWDEGWQRDIDVAGLDGYLEAWKAFTRERVASIEAVEMLVFHPQALYAGTLDRALYLNDKPEELSIVDIKTGILHDEYAMQTAAYQHAYNQGQKGKKATRRAVAQLLPNGDYNVVEYKDKSDISAYLSALNVHNWRANRGKN